MEIPTLTKNQIEVKIKKVTEKGAIALLYKTARTDMEILDEVFTPFGWQTSYREIKGNLYCEIRIRDNQTGEWISKEDCGIESREDDEGNQKKGEASDAFKRAGFKWGIGRELYTSPFVFLNLPTEQKNGSWKLKNPFQQFEVSKVEFDESRTMVELAISSGRDVVYQWKLGTGQESLPAKPQSISSVASDLISNEQYQNLLAMVSDGEANPIQSELDRLVKIYKKFGYQKAKEIKAKDYQMIIDEYMGKLPWEN